MADQDDEARDFPERPEPPDNPWPSDPVIFGSPPFGPPAQDGEPSAPRLTWAIVVGILVVVMVLVGAMGIWVR